MTRGKLAFLAGVVTAFAVVACSSSSGGALTNDNDAGSTDDTSMDAGSGSKDSGQNPPKGDAGAVACGTRVNSGVVFNDAGAIYCAANMPCALASDTCCVGALGMGSCKSGHNGCGASALGPQAAFECVEDTDCPTNQVCCGYVDTTMDTAGSKCQAIGANNKCPAPVANTQSAVQFCQKTCECKDGSECIPQACSIGGAGSGIPPANLTLCGLQTSSGFGNCTAR